MQAGFEAMFWGAAAIFLYGYAGYPALVALRARVRPRPVAARAITPSVSLIVTVHNGQRMIADKLENCLALDYPSERLEILVASDGSTDGTNEIVRGVGDARVRLVALPSRQGKERAQREAIRAAQGEILVFTDAGVRTDPGVLRTLVTSFADVRVGCVSCVDRVVNAKGEAEGEGAFVRYETLIKECEAQSGSIVGNSGWFFAVRRELTDEWPGDMASDFTMLLRTVRRGYRGIVDPNVVASAMATTSNALEFQRKVRTIVRGMVVLSEHREMLNPLRYGFFAIQLWSHKIFRWSLPFMLGAALLSSAVLAPGSTFFQALFVAQALFYGIGIVLPAVRIPHFFVSASLAASVAWWKFLTGERFVTWEPTPRVHGVSR